MVEFSDVSGSKPPDVVLVVELFGRLVRVVEVAHRNVLAADVDFSTREGFVTDLKVKKYIYKAQERNYAHKL